MDSMFEWPFSNWHSPLKPNYYNNSVNRSSLTTYESAMQRVVSVVVFLVLFQRVVRAGSLVTLEHSLDGVNYKKAGSFQQNGVRGRL